MQVIPFRYGEPAPPLAALSYEEEQPPVAGNTDEIETAAFERGREQERRDSVQRLAQEAERMRAEAAQVLGDFQSERERHLRRMEDECAALALAIARKVLRREAEMDPLMMQAAVRVALERVDAATVIRLRVPSQNAVLWEGSLRGKKVQIIPDDGLLPDGLVLETEIGTADLGWTAQVREIESGFSEMLNARSGAVQ